MKSLDGTQTEENLKKALAGEAQARDLYSFYASQARKEGYVRFSEVISHIAENEKEHGKIWFKQLQGGQIPGLETCLEDCIKGEHEEWTEMYPSFARVAREEGFPEIALLFDRVANIEKAHEAAFANMLAQIREQKVFESDQEACWVCLECGFVHNGTKAPMVCPVCGHEQPFFMRNG